jgi:hypothetical protein
MIAAIFTQVYIDESLRHPVERCSTLFPHVLKLGGKEGKNIDIIYGTVTVQTYTAYLLSAK